MQELFLLLADYNSRTNQELFGILEAAPAPAELVSRKCGLWHDSILAVLNHVVVADAIWLRRFAQFPEVAFVPPALPSFEVQTLKDVVWDSLPSLRPVREAVDELLRRVAQELPPDRYAHTLEYRNIRGRAQSKITWRALLHVFNHQTHHRGQIAAILDQSGVENDYSNLIWKY